MRAKLRRQFFFFLIQKINDDVIFPVLVLISEKFGGFGLGLGRGGLDYSFGSRISSDEMVLKIFIYTIAKPHYKKVNSLRSR